MSAASSAGPGRRPTSRRAPRTGHRPRRRRHGFQGGPLLSAILTYGKAKGFVAANVARGVRRPEDNQRTRRLTPDEYRRLGEALDRVLLEGAPAHAVAVVWLLALTGCRKGGGLR